MRTGYVGGLIQKHMSKNPKPDLFIILGRTDIAELVEFHKFLIEKFEEKHETLPKDWILLLLKKRKKLVFSFARVLD